MAVVVVVAVVVAPFAVAVVVVVIVVVVAVQGHADTRSKHRPPNFPQVAKGLPPDAFLVTGRQDQGRRWER